MYRICESVRSTHGQDGAIVLDIKQGQMFNVNLAGSRILELLETGTPASKIADAISREFEISRETAMQDVQEFLQTLQERRLLEEAI
jgi:fibrillarin-like rRNA methylase